MLLVFTLISLFAFAIVQITVVVFKDAHPPPPPPVGPCSSSCNGGYASCPVSDPNQQSLVLYTSFDNPINGECYTYTNSISESCTFGTLVLRPFCLQRIGVNQCALPVGLGGNAAAKARLAFTAPDQTAQSNTNPAILLTENGQLQLQQVTIYVLSGTSLECDLACCIMEPIRTINIDGCPPASTSILS